MRQNPLFCLVSGGNRAQAQGLPSIPLQPLGDLVANSSCTGQIEVSAVGNPSITGGRWQPAGGERAGQGIYLGHCCQNSQRPWEASVQGESCPVEERLGVFLLFQQSSSSSFFFIFFFSTLISLRDLIVSQVAHQVHSIGCLEEDALCIDE